MFKNISEVKQANEDIGNYWFSDNAMSFFESVVESDLITLDDIQYFISSEQPPYGKRFYSIRIVNEDGSIATLGKFNENKFFDTNDAIEYLNQYREEI